MMNQGLSVPKLLEYYWLLHLVLVWILNMEYMDMEIVLDICKFIQIAFWSLFIWMSFLLLEQICKNLQIYSYFCDPSH